MLRVLGGVEIDDHGVVRSRAQRLLLEALALDAGRVVASSRLAELVWGDDQPENPGASLQNHVSRVRKILPPGCAVVSEADGYRLDAAPGSLDLSVYDAAFDAACSAPPDKRLGFVQEALSLWRGEPFRELDDDHALAEGARLRERWAALTDMRAEALLAGGRPLEAIADLEAMRQSDPLRERTVELLMHAYVDAEDKTRALQVYRELREQLVEQLGLDPSPTLRDLEAAIITEDRTAAAPSVPPAEPLARQGRPRAATVPIPVAPLVGREQAMARLAALVGHQRIVTITGPGGVGKTRLAIEVALQVEDRFSGVSMVDLSRVLDAGQLDEVVAGQLGLQPRSDVSDVDRIVEAIGSRRHLLVLDNCEHVIEAAADLVAGLVAGAVELVVLTTSREPMGVAGEHVVRLAPLAIGGDAVTLFVERASSVTGGEFRADDRDARRLVEDICDLVDGLPLAIELAASRCASASLLEIRNGLAEPMATLQARRGSDRRHGSLRALVDWSARDLDAELTQVFNGVSVFAGPFTADAVAAVVGMTPLAAATALADLAERSLLVVDSQRPDGLTRFRCLATIRAYASELLEATPAVAETVERHRAWALDLAERAYATSPDPGGDRDYEAVIASLAELRLAHQHFAATGDPDRAMRLVAALHLVLLVQMQSEVGEWTIATAARFGERDHPLCEDILALASMASWLAGDLDGAERFADDAEAAASRSGATTAGRGTAEARADLSLFAGDNRAAFAHFDRALALARTGGNRLRIITALADSATAAGYLGDVATAQARIAEARAMLAADAAPGLRAWVAYAEGEALAESNPRRALEALSEAIELAVAGDAAFVAGVAGLTRTGLQLRGGATSDAVRGMVDLLKLWRRTGATVQQWIALRTVVELLVELGEHEPAGEVLGAVLDTASATEVAGPDAERLAEARVAIEATLSSIDDVLARGAAKDHAELVDEVITLLERHLPDPVAATPSGDRARMPD